MSIELLAAGSSPPGQTPLREVTELPQTLSWVERVAFLNILTMKSLTINQISLSENTPKHTYTSIYKFKIFPGVIPRTPVKGKRIGEGRERGGLRGWDWGKYASGA